jgi:AMMECR1 domain-containing protein
VLSAIQDERAQDLKRKEMNALSCNMSVSDGTNGIKERLMELEAWMVTGNFT